MNKPYMIADPEGRFFRGWTDSIPLIIHGFTESLDFAARFDSLEAAKNTKATLLEGLYEFDGNTKVSVDYLKIVKIELKAVA